MHHFQYRENQLYCENVPVQKIAKEVGTPLYLYSHATLIKHFRAFDGAFKDIKHLTCFSMKSNSNIAILRLFFNKGGGVDIVSGGELFRALKAGIDPKKVVYSGVGKTDEDMEYALKSEIMLFNVESRQELLRLNTIAERLNKKAPVSIRVNPDIDPMTHPYISTGLRENKFGIPIEDAPEIYELAKGMSHIDIKGVSCHIGSQLTKVSPFVDALKRLIHLIEGLKRRGIDIDYLDIGGGLGITYSKESPPHPEQYASAIKKEIKNRLTLILEPGRVITGNAGILVTRVIYTKSIGKKNFIIVDAAMNDLMRPALYGSFHGIQPVVFSPDRNKLKADVVGPICESGDFLAKEREIYSFELGEYMAVMSAGAYGFSMSSNYNSRPRPAEVMVKGEHYSVIRERESYEDLIKGESIPDFIMKA